MKTYDELLRMGPAPSLPVEPPESCPDCDEIDDFFPLPNREQDRLLNSAVHSGSFTASPATVDVFVAGLEELVSAGMLLPVGKDKYSVPREVAFHPAGPGRRLDQPVGCLHRLPKEIRRQWLASLDLAENYRGMLQLGEKIYSARTTDEHLEALSSGIEGGSFIEKSEFPELPDDLTGLYGELTADGDEIQFLIAHGFLLPHWDENGRITKFIPDERLQGRLDLRHSDFLESLCSQISPPQLDAAEEGQWSRHPFQLPEQLKMFLVLADALPFRTTENNYPHRFDIKEASRLLGWEKKHCCLLLDLLLENNLLVAGEERYYLSEEVEATPDDFGVSLLETGLDLTGRSEGEGTSVSSGVDFSAGELFLELRSSLAGAGPRQPEEIVTEKLAEKVWLHLAAGLVEGMAPEDRAVELLDTVLKSFYWFGGADVRKFTDRWEISLNGYGQKLPGDITASAPAEDMPFILQDDGTVMVPLESSLEEFRAINPFALLVSMDRLIEYQIDKQSLVEALNGGWDVNRFKSFLVDKNGELPPGLQSLFKEVGGEGESIRIREVYHLLEFERGATAAEAMSVLSNYDPLRLETEKILLRKQTSEETIRRNLSRAGIKMAGGGDKLRGLSPLVEVQ